MSLINEMLKELDARRADVGGGAFGEQVRAVPERHGIHPAWWLALVLALALGGVLAWVMLRPPVLDPYMVQTQLPLKFDVTLGVQAGEGSRLPEPETMLPDSPVDPAAPAAPAASAVPAAEPVEPAPAQIVAPEAQAVPERVPPPDVRAVEGRVAERAPLASTPPKPAVAASAKGEEGAQPAPVRVTKQVRELTPQQRAENEFRRATLALQQNRRAEAAAALEQALALDSRHAGARQTLIGVLLDAKRTAEATELAREGLELDVRQIGLAMILARLQLDHNDLAGALATLERSRAHAGERPDYLAFQAALLQRAERHREAAEQYSLALASTPRNALWWMGMGISLQADGRHAEAREAYGRAKTEPGLTPDLLAFVEARLAQLK